MAENSDDMVTLSAPRDRVVRLACQIIGQANKAREQLLEHNNPTAALAHYYRMDTELLGRAFNFADDELQQEILAAVAEGVNEGGK